MLQLKNVYISIDLYYDDFSLKYQLNIKAFFEDEPIKNMKPTDVCW